MNYWKPLLLLSITTLLIIGIENSEKFIYKFGTTKAKQKLQLANAAPSVDEAKKEVTGKVAELKTFAKKNKCDTTVAFILNMRVKSSKPRFWVFNLTNSKVTNMGLVAHGSGSGDVDGLPLTFSNKPNSLATSLGKYVTGERYMGKFGLAYKLHGKETTNNNAFARAVVLHAHSCVPEEEVNYPICLSWGCPTVAPKFLNTIDTIIKSKAKPIALWIYK
jgi:hypothetical protein